MKAYPNNSRRSASSFWAERRISQLSLSRLRQSQGKKAEPHQLLSEIYNRFTEGFDTKDLQEAKALLQDLVGRQ